MIDFIKTNFGIVTTLLVSYMTFLGMLYQYSLLNCIGVNVFHYSTGNDFLAAFGRGAPMIAFGLFLNFMIYFISISLEQRHLEGKNFVARYRQAIKITSVGTTRTIFALSTFIGFIGLSVMGGRQEADSFRSRFDNFIAIPKNTADKLGVPQIGQLADTTNRYAFIIFSDRVAIINRDQLPSYSLLSEATVKKDSITVGSFSGLTPDWKYMGEVFEKKLKR